MCLWSAGVIREHPEIVGQIVKTHIRASDFARQNLNETAEIYARKNSANVEEIKASLRDWDGDFVTDPNVIISPARLCTHPGRVCGYIKKSLTQGDLFDLTFYKKVKG